MITTFLGCLEVYGRPKVLKTWIFPCRRLGTQRPYGPLSLFLTFHALPTWWMDTNTSKHLVMTVSMHRHAFRTISWCFKHFQALSGTLNEKTWKNVKIFTWRHFLVFVRKTWLYHLGRILNTGFGQISSRAARIWSYIPPTSKKFRLPAAQSEVPLSGGQGGAPPI